MVRWRHMTGSIQERSHFLAPTVKNHWHNHSLKAHENGHMGGKSYACLTFHMSFSLSHYLKRHARIHGGEKPFSLSKCVKAFLEVVNWKHKWPTQERSPLSVKNVKGHLYKVVVWKPIKGSMQQRCHLPLSNVASILHFTKVTGESRTPARLWPHVGYRWVRLGLRITLV